MSATVESRNDKIAGLGSLGLHAVLIALLFLVKCPGTGGGGGNDGLGNSGYMSMDVAGIGNDVDGWGPTQEEVEVTPTQPQPVVEDAGSVTDDSQVEDAPIVTPNKPTATPTPKPTPTPTPKPEPTPEPKPGKAVGIIKGSGSSSGNTNQGTEDGTIGGKGVLGGGGSQGTGGGTGGGQGTGSGTGTGAGSGPGSGGGSKADHTLAGRTMMKPPTLGENFEENATMVVNVTVDGQGKVISAKTDPVKSKFPPGYNFESLAEKAAMSTQFDVSKTGATQQRGTITIYFKAK